MYTRAIGEASREERCQSTDKPHVPVRSVEAHALREGK